MRSSTAILVLGAAFAVADPVADPIPQSLDVLASELPSLVSELPAVLSTIAPEIPAELSFFIQEFAPTAVISDLPAILSANIGALETLALGEIPAGALTPAESTAVFAAAPPVFTELEADIDSLLAELPQTLSVAAIPGLLSGNLGLVETEIASIASFLEPQVSAILTSLDGVATGAAGTITAQASGATLTTSGLNLTTTYTSPSIPIATGAASNHGLNKELFGAAAVVGAIGVLGAML